MTTLSFFFVCVNKSILYKEALLTGKEHDARRSLSLVFFRERLVRDTLRITDRQRKNDAFFHFS